MYAHYILLNTLFDCFTCKYINSIIFIRLKNDDLKVTRECMTTGYDISPTGYFDMTCTIRFCLFFKNFLQSVIFQK